MVERAKRSVVAVPLCASLLVHGAVGLTWWRLEGLGVGRGEAGTSVGGGAPAMFSALVMLEEKAIAPKPTEPARAVVRPNLAEQRAARVAEPELSRKRVEMLTGDGNAASAVTATARGPVIDAPVAASPGAADAGADVSAAGARGEGSLTFAGLSADPALASSVVYVVDASAPMVSTLPWVLGEVERSVAGLLPTQRFNVVLFGERGQGGQGGGAARVFSAGLVDTTSRQRAKLAEYLRGAEAAGRSTPIVGLREAMRMKPRVVFVLARAIARTQGAQWDQGNEAIMSELEALNPVDPATGRRATVIKVIQFLDADPTGLLPRIAAVHGEPAGVGTSAGAGGAIARGEPANLRTVTRAEVAAGGGGGGVEPGSPVNLGVR